MKGKIYVSRITGDAVEVETEDARGGVYFHSVGEHEMPSWMSLDSFEKMFDPN